MYLKSVNSGEIQIYQNWRSGTPSAIHKCSVDGAVEVGLLGLVGDEQADTKNHGGVDKAVFIMSQESYARFKVDEPYGFLGENLTVKGLDEKQICLGDRFQIGTVLLEVSQPRSPCWKLGEHAITQAAWGSAEEFLSAYSESGHVGLYCRVLEVGKLQAGDEIIWTPSEPDAQGRRFTIHDLFLARQFHRTQADWKLLEGVIEHSALTASWHKSIRVLLESRPNNF